ncbi:MAG: alanine racemase [Pseudomonadota bacterium]
MFLDVLRRRNPRFIETAIALHQAGQVPANALMIDLDAVEANARRFKTEADRLGLATFAMTKQVGRSSSFCAAAKRGGIDEVVAVDMACAIACHRADMGIGHLGHLAQVPKFEAPAGAKLSPRYWTVFSETKAREAAAAARALGRDQPLLARIYADGDTFYRGHEGGFEADEIAQVADAMDRLDGGHFAGITTFPALLFDPERRRVAPTPNLRTLERAAETLAMAGRGSIEINAPGTTSTVTLQALADAGVTQCEPGNGLHGTTPLHAIEDLPELPATLYLSEISHLHGGDAYCFGGGLYIDPVFPDYQVRAIVSDTPTSSEATLADVEIPPPSAIDYYGMVSCEGPVSPKPGDSVVFGFRAQAFVTRCFVVGVSGVMSGEAKVESIENSFGQPMDWPG